MMQVIYDVGKKEPHGFPDFLLTDILCELVKFAHLDAIIPY